MTALALRVRQINAPRLPRGPVFRMIAGGTLWGLVLSAGLLALTFHGCGTVCLGDALITTTLAIVAGIATIGPVTVLSARN